MSTLFDAHCHIDPGYDGGPGAGESTLAGRLLCGVSDGDWQCVALAAAAWPGTVAAYGQHPWHTPETGDWLDKMEDFLRRDPAAWVGEIGLDANKSGIESPEAAERLFAEQLRLARRLDRPVNLHCVKAWGSLVDILDREYLTDDRFRPFIIHSFGGPHQFIDILNDRGAYFTVGPLSMRHDTRRQRERAALLPDDRLLLESDEYLSPKRDAREEVESALAWLAEVKGMDVDIMAAVIAENSRRLFNDG